MYGIVHAKENQVESEVSCTLISNLCSYLYSCMIIFLNVGRASFSKQKRNLKVIDLYFSISPILCMGSIFRILHGIASPPIIGTSKFSIICLTS